MSLSDYELQRLANIAKNQAVLDDLGLGGNNKLVETKKKKPPQPKRKRDDDDDDDTAQIILRRSSRTNDNVNPVYTELSDQFMLAEEKGLILRTRRTTKTIDRYDEIQAKEEQERVANIQQRQAAKAKALEQQRQRQAMLRTRTLPAIRERRTYQPSDDEAQLLMTREIAVPRYPTARPPEICPYCRGEFVPKADGSMRKHVCVPVDVVLPMFS